MNQQLSPSELARALAAQRRQERKPCAVCGTEIIGTTRRLYCSPACAGRASYARHADKRRAEKREQYRRQKGQPAGEVPQGRDGQGTA
ncbi:MAG: hypothetical protein HY690_15335 [Chloroflexi bacterium]|nr:hypothetical protein [Chloroflexota bacterium]